MYPINTPINSQLYQQLLQPIQNQQKVIEVSGRPGAEAYQLAPDSSVLLLDTTCPMVWLVKTDGAGYKTLRGYDIKEHEEEKPTDALKSLEERISKLEEAIHAKQPNAGNAAKRKSDSSEQQ